MKSTGTYGTNAVDWEDARSPSTGCAPSGWRG